MTMSEIVKFRDGTVIEYWETADIAEYLDIPKHKAKRLHELANKEYKVVGYGPIDKEDFLEFISKIEEANESQRLQDEANAAQIVYSQKGYSLNRFSFFVTEALSLLRNI